MIGMGDYGVEVGPPQRCVVLAALAVDAGRLVTHDTLVERVWGSAPPLRAWRTVQTHIAHLRSLLKRIDSSTQATVTVRRRSGYVLHLDPDLIDVHRLRRLAVEAADAARPGLDRLAQLREAVGLWRGEPLAGLSGAWVERTRQAWYDQYRDVVTSWTMTEIEAGNPAAGLDRLDALLLRYPLDESLPATLMQALYAAGRRTEALTCYAAIRQRLDEELAERPGPQLQAVYRAILRREPTLRAPTEAAPAETAVPAQLPADVRGFAGRTEHLARLDSIATTLAEGEGGGDDHATAVVISAIAGTAGIGKTALAVHWAHRVANRFPDGQLYVNLRGFDPGGTIVDPATAIRGLLDALAIPPERIPADPNAQAGLYRTTVADKRMLIVLDNARDTTQIRPLLPGAPGCLVLVTSRNRLTGLIAETGAYSLPLDLLTPDEARDLLTQRLGLRRITAEPEAVAALMRRCAFLPLALAVVAARAATQPQLSLAALAAELHDSGARLDALATDDPATDPGAVFSWSYHALTPPAARLFRLLGLHPGPDITAAAAASLAALTPTRARPLLAELSTASLIAEHRPGRYTFHDLLRGYATQLAHTIDTDQQRHAATGRILDHYLHTAHPADRLLNPARDPLPLIPPRAGVTPEQLSDHAQAMGWFTTEHQVLLAAVAHAAATGLDTHTYQLAYTLQTFVARRGHWHDWVAIGRAAVTAAQRLADPTAQARAQRPLAAAYTQLGRLDDAHTQLHQALDMASRAGDQTQQAHAHHQLAILWERRGQPTQILHHAQQALHLYQATGDQVGQALALNQVGWCHILLGEHRQALTDCQQALTLLEQHGDRAGQAVTWDSLGYAHHHLGQHAQALTCFQHALNLNRDIGDRYQEATALTHVGDAHRAVGNPHAARGAWQQALAILDDLDHPDASETRAKIEQLDRSCPFT
jgi:DNA-binding SARP family transcriptional activator/Tfp pilus assembly protein PilF